MNRRYTERDKFRIPCRAFLSKITGAGTHTSSCSAKHTAMGTQCSTYISMVTENFLSTLNRDPRLAEFTRLASPRGEARQNFLHRGEHELTLQLAESTRLYL